MRNLLQEMRELGWRGTSFRIGWELRQRLGIRARLARRPPSVESRIAEGDWISRLPFPDPDVVADAMRNRIPAPQRAALLELASQAIHGRILCFGRWVADYGDPIDWHLNPVTGQRWDRDAPWPTAFRDEARVGDVKMTWEIARFPHAYHIARAAAFHPEHSAELGRALLTQMQQFTRDNPFGRGVHWASGQEIAFRLLAWLFALDTLLSRGADGRHAAALVAEELVVGAEHIADNIDYARFAVYNNHLLSEALALYAAGVLLPEVPQAQRWRNFGHQILCEEAGRQFGADGAYIQLSHNYHRVALQALLWASVLARASREAPAAAWLDAMDRSLSFLVAHQNPSDGRLPNYGANDGALPSVLSTCDFSDFRPLLQAVSVTVRGERLFDAGPWDETAVWLCGPEALDRPLRAFRRGSVSFAASGFHVIRGRDESSFAAFRCGSIRDRFSQIDMLHLDVWWRGLNILVDGGSFQYNAATEWHDHFFRTASHNTVQVDGHDQMLHFRRFKCLYWTRARLLEFEDGPEFAVCTGEHYGFQRHPGGCIHRRSFLHIKDDCWVVVDRVTGTGTHAVRLHWLAAPMPHAYAAGDGRMTLETPHGPFSVSVYDDAGRSLAGTVIAGQERPPRGWLARYYGERVAAPSLAIERTRDVPVTMISLLGAGAPELVLDGNAYVVTTGGRTVRFRIHEGTITLANRAR